MPTPARSQPLLIRLTHWLHVPALAIMAMSGLQILRAYPYFGPVGERWTWVPLQGWDSPSLLRAGGWLAGARHLHFAFAWLLVINAVVYLGYLAASGQWRRRLFWAPRDARLAARELWCFLRRRPQAPRVELYGGLQRAAYTAALALGVIEVLSGLAIWKPVQLHWLATPMGGYDGARVVHFLALLALGAFAIVHVVMAIVRGRIPAMITGAARAKPRAPSHDQAPSGADQEPPP